MRVYNCFTTFTTSPLKAQKQNLGTLLPSAFILVMVSNSTFHSSQYITALVTSSISTSTPASDSMDMSLRMTYSSWLRK